MCKGVLSVSLKIKPVKPEPWFCVWVNQFGFLLVGVGVDIHVSERGELADVAARLRLGVGA